MRHVHDAAGQVFAAGTIGEHFVANLQLVSRGLRTPLPQHQRGVHRRMRTEFSSYHEVAEFLFRQDGGARRSLLVADDAVDHAPDLHLVRRNDKFVEALAVEEQLEAVLLLGGRQGIRRTALLGGGGGDRKNETRKTRKHFSHAHMIRPSQSSAALRRWKPGRGIIPTLIRRVSPQRRHDATTCNGQISRRQGLSASISARPTAPLRSWLARNLRLLNFHHRAVPPTPSRRCSTSNVAKKARSPA